MFPGEARHLLAHPLLSIQQIAPSRLWKRGEGRHGRGSGRDARGRAAGSHATAHAAGIPGADRTNGTCPAAGGVATWLGRRGVCVRRARNIQCPHWHHCADGLLVARHGLRVRTLQKVWDRSYYLQGGILGCHSGPLEPGRKSGLAPPSWHRVLLDDGASWLACEADAYTLLSQPQRPGHHAQERILNEGDQDPRDPQAPGRSCQAGRDTTDLCDDLPSWYACDVDALLAGVRGHSPRQRHHPHYYSASANGSQYEGGQDGRLLRRGALER